MIRFTSIQQALFTYLLIYDFMKSVWRRLHGFPVSSCVKLVYQSHLVQQIYFSFVLIRKGNQNLAIGVIPSACSENCPKCYLNRHSEA